MKLLYPAIITGRSGEKDYLCKFLDFANLTLQSPSLQKLATKGAESTP